MFAHSLLFAFLLTFPAVLRAEGPTKVAYVGDSITFGAAIKDRAKNSYPAQLQAILGEDYLVKNFGNSGSTLLKQGDKPYWKQQEFAAAKEFAPDIVVIKLGSNDTKPQNWKHKEDFAGDYKAMITEFRNLPSKPVIYVCLPVPAFPERWGIRDSVINEELIPATRTIAQESDAILIDLNKPLRGKTEHFPDKIHPNRDGAKIIAETVAEALRAQPVTN